MMASSLFSPALSAVDLERVTLITAAVLPIVPMYTVEFAEA